MLPADFYRVALEGFVDVVWFSKGFKVSSWSHSACEEGERVILYSLLPFISEGHHI